ncbi:MAG: hypothetical protein WA081_09380 [Desulfosalsimonadaceae bacterium]
MFDVQGLFSKMTIEHPVFNCENKFTVTPYGIPTGFRQIAQGCGLLQFTVLIYFSLPRKVEEKRADGKRLEPKRDRFWGITNTVS